MCYIYILCGTSLLPGSFILRGRLNRSQNPYFQKFLAKIRANCTSMMDGFGQHVFLPGSWVVEETEGNPNSQTPTQRSGSFPVISARELLSATSQALSPSSALPEAHARAQSPRYVASCTLHDQRFKGLVSKRRAPGILGVRLPGVVTHHLPGDQKMLK